MSINLLAKYSNRNANCLSHISSYIRNKGEAAWKEAGSRVKETVDVGREVAPLVATIAGAPQVALVIEIENIVIDVSEGNYDDATMSTIITVGG